MIPLKWGTYLRDPLVSPLPDPGHVNAGPQEIQRSRWVKTVGRDQSEDAASPGLSLSSERRTTQPAFLGDPSALPKSHFPDLLGSRQLTCPLAFGKAES